MRRRWLRIAMLAWVVGWFVFFLPGHKRGYVKLNPGDDDCDCCAGAAPSAPAEEADTCPLCSRQARSAVPPQGVPAPAKDPVRNCAVCFLVTHTPPPPPLIVVDTTATLVERVKDALPERVQALQVIRAYWALPPPRPAAAQA